MKGWRLRHARRLIVVVAAATVCAGLALATITGLAVAAVVPVLTVVVAVLARTLGWRTAMALGLLGSMVAEVCYLRVTPLLGWDLAAADLALWALAGAAGVVLLARWGPPALSRTQVESLGVALVVPVVGLVAYVAKVVSSDGTWIGWAMKNDVAYRSLMVRWSLEDHGLTADRGYSDPLTSGLLAVWSARVSGPDDLGALMRVIVHSGAQVWILLWLTVSMICSVIALRGSQRVTAYRVVTGVVAALVPWTWFVSGSAFELGFQNVAASTLVILLAWVLWTQRQQQPVACLAGLLLATLAAAMAWAPLAPIPLLWAVGTFCLQRTALRGASRRARLVPAAALALGVVYGAAVTLPETLGSGTGGLAADGAIQFVSWRWTVSCTVVIVAASIVLARRMSPTYRWGLWLTVCASAVVAGYLLLQRRDSPTLWGYYPIKFTSLVTSAALLIGVAESMAALAVLRRWWWRMAGALVAVAVALGVMLQVTPAWAPGSRFTPVALAGDHRYDGAAQAMFHILDTHPKSFVARYSPGRWTGPQEDGFMNFWLFQMSAESGDDPIRGPAYHFDPMDAAAACEKTAGWGSDIDVWTRSRAVARAYERSCPADQFDVRLRGRLFLPSGS